MQKNTLLLFIGLAVAAVANAQPGSANPKAENQLKANLATIDDLTKMLTTEYTQSTSAEKTVSGATFKFKECRVLTSFGDEALQAQVKQMEKELGDGFNGSSWKFQPYNQYNNVSVTVTPLKGEAVTSNYTGFPGSATIRMGTLIQGLDVEAYFYQKKTDNNSYIMVFAIMNGVSCVAEITK